MVDFTYVDRDAQLRGLVLQWKQVPELALDLEMEAHLHHFGLHLSLVQVSDGKDAWVVDMLAIQDTSTLVELLENKSVTKVFHDVSFDFRVLEELYDCRPKNIIDTKAAALLLGKESISLAGLLKEYFNVDKNEKFQRIDWMQRPLKADMLSYAAGDVKLLLQLKDKLLLGLREKGRLSWLKEECAYIETQSYASSPRTFQDVKGARSLTDKQRGILKEFYAERDKIAEHLDKPVFFIIPDKILMQFVKEPPRTEDAWNKIRGIHPVVKKRSFRFLKALQRAKPVEKIPRTRRRLSFKQQDAVEALLKRRDNMLGGVGVESHVLLTRDQAEQWVLGEKDIFREWQLSLLKEAKVI